MTTIKTKHVPAGGGRGKESKKTGLAVGSLDDLLQSRLGPDRLARARKRADAILERMSLEQLRKARNTSQAKLAQAMQIQQSEVSRIEKRSEVKLGTLRDYIQGLGGHIEVRAVFPDKNVELAIAAAE